MLRTYFASAITALSLVQPAIAQSIMDGSGTDLDDATRGAIYRAFVPVVTDPYAIQIIRLERQGDAVCGYYNAKNQYGGYTGFKPFKFIVERQKLYPETEC